MMFEKEDLIDALQEALKESSHITFMTSPLTDFVLFLSASFSFLFFFLKH